MGIFGLFAKPTTDEGVKEYQETQGAVLLDVRTPQEYAEGHIPGSCNIPLDTLELTEEKVPDMETPIFVYCHSGVRSSQASVLLERMGYSRVKNIGGITGYHGEVEK